MSRYGTVLGGSANVRTLIAQGSDVESMLASIAAVGSAVVAQQPPLVNPVVTSISLAGSGDGAMFYAEFEFASQANVDGGLALSTVLPLLAATAEDLKKQIDALQTSSAIADILLAGASQGQRVMALVVAGNVLPSLGCSCTVVWRPDGLGDETTFEGVMRHVAANKGPITIFCPQLDAGVVYVIEPGPPPATPVVYDMKGAILKGPEAPHDAVKVQLRRGATLFNLGGVSNGLRLQANKQVGDPEGLTFPAVPGGSWTFPVTEGAEIKNLSNATAPLLLVPTTNEFYLAFSQLGTADCENGGFPTVQAPVGATLNVVAIAGGLSLDTIQQSGWIGSAVGATVNWIHDGTMAMPLGFWTTYHPANLGTQVNQPTGLVGGSGPTAFRPVFQGGGNPSFGCMFFDESLNTGTGKPIWFNAGNGGQGPWVDATGTTA